MTPYIAVAASTLLLCSACDGAERRAAVATPRDTCSDASATVVDAVGSGVTGQGLRLAAGVVVEIPVEIRINPTYPAALFAARIDKNDSRGQLAGVWAVATLAGGSPILALNSSAREHSDWGAAAQPGSRAAELRDKMAAYPQVAVAEACALK